MIAVSDVFSYQRAVRDRAPARLRLLLYTLSTYQGPGGSIHPSADTLASNMGLKRRQIFNLIKEAEACGWLQKSRRSGRSSVYSLAIPVQPIAPLPMQPIARGGATHCTGGVQPIARGVCNPLHPKNTEKNTEKNTLKRAPSKVAKLRAKVAERWQVPIIVHEATLAAWLEPMETSEIRAALDDFDRRLQYANKCGSPMRKGRRPAVLAEVLEIHAKERPNKPALPDLTFAEEAPATPERKGDGGKAMLRAFFHAKGLVAPFDMKKEGTG